MMTARQHLLLAIAIVVAMTLGCYCLAHAQYNPIPNYGPGGAIQAATPNTGGYYFRQAVNNKLSGADTISPQLVHIYFAQLPASVTNGQMFYVNDGAPGAPCGGGGKGAIAQGINGQWVCISTNDLSGGTPWNPWTTVTAEAETTGTGSAGPYTFTLAHPGVIPGPAAAQPLTIYVNGTAEGTDQWGAGTLSGSGIAATVPSKSEQCYVNYESGAGSCTFASTVGSGVAITASYTYAVPPPSVIAGYTGAPQGLLNVGAWGAVGRHNSVNCTATSGSPTLTGCGTIPSHITVGRYVQAIGGGPVASISWPTPPVNDTGSVTSGLSCLTLDTLTYSSIPLGTPLQIATAGPAGDMPFDTFVVFNTPTSSCAGLTIQGQAQHTVSHGTVIFGPTATPHTWINPVAGGTGAWLAPGNQAQGSSGDYDSYEGCIIDAPSSISSFQTSHAYSVGDEVGAPISITDAHGQTHTAMGIFIVYQAGTSAGSAPTWPTVFGGTVLSSTVRFSLQGLAGTPNQILPAHANFQPGTVVVKNTSDSTTYTLGTDYFLRTAAIVRNVSGSIAPNQAMHISYQYYAGSTLTTVTDEADTFADAANTNGVGPNTGCTTVHGYQLYALTAFDGWVAYPSVIYTMHSGSISNSDGPAVESIDNRIAVQWLDAVNARGVAIATCTGSSCTPSTTIKTVVPARYDGLLNRWWDVSNNLVVGQDVQWGTTVPGTVPSHGNLDGVYVTGISGTTITLSAPLGANGSVTVISDDWPATQAAVSWACARYAANLNAGTPSVYLPADANWIWSQPLDFHGCAGMHFYGASGSAGQSASTNIIYTGPPGGPVIELNDSRDATFENFTQVNTAGNLTQYSTPGATIDVDEYGYVDQNTTNSKFRHIQLGVSGYSSMSFSKTDPFGNIENMVVDDVGANCPSSNTGALFGVTIGGAMDATGQTNEEHFNNDFFGCSQVMFRFPNQGELYVNGVNGYNNTQLYFWGAAKHLSVSNWYDEQGGKLAELVASQNSKVSFQHGYMLEGLWGRQSMPSSSYMFVNSNLTPTGGQVLLSDFAFGSGASSNPGYDLWPAFLFNGPGSSASRSPLALCERCVMINSDPFGQALMPASYTNPWDEVADSWVDPTGIDYNLGLSIAGHEQLSGGGTPTPSTGTASVEPGATDSGGYFVVSSTNPTASAAIVFANPWPAQPDCTCTEEATATSVQPMACRPSSDGTKLTAVVATDFHSDVVHYRCESHGG